MPIMKCSTTSITLMAATGNIINNNNNNRIKRDRQLKKSKTSVAVVALAINNFLIPSSQPAPNLKCIQIRFLFLFFSRVRERTNATSNWVVMCFRSRKAVVLMDH